MPKKINYKNEEYNKIIKKILSNKETITEKTFEPHFLKKCNNKEKKEFVKLLIDTDTNIILDSEKINKTKKTFKNYLNNNFADYLVDYLIGYKEISKLMDSEKFEEIMINDYDKIFVMDRNNRCYKTNIIFEKENFDVFLDSIKKTLLADFKEREFIDGILPNQSRINVVSKNITKFNTITIRKNFKKPLNIINLIKNKELTPEIATYLWIVIDGLQVKPANLFICGGTGTGKTTLLNCLLDFIPSDERIIGVEDTLEIDYSNFENHICMSSNISDIDSLYKISINILRMRPDRIIIGETRGKEVKTLFLAMSTGHEGCLSTIHANNVSELINKLSSQPFNIEKSYLSLLNVVVTLKKIKRNNTTNRFIFQISEISKIGNITTNDIYLKENSTEKINFMASSFLEKICEILEISKTELKKIIEYRLSIINKMVNENITDTNKIRQIISKNRDINIK